MLDYTLRDSCRGRQLSCEGYGWHGYAVLLLVAYLRPRKHKNIRLHLSGIQGGLTQLREVYALIPLNKPSRAKTMSPSISLKKKLAVYFWSLFSNTTCTHHCICQKNEYAVVHTWRRLEGDFLPLPFFPSASEFWKGSAFQVKEQTSCPNKTH